MSRRALILLVAIISTSSLAACQPTGSPRCDALIAQVSRAESMGYRIRCDAPFAGVRDDGRPLLGWADHRTHTLWLWPDRLRDDRALRKVAWHEIGHVVWDGQHRTGTQAAEELWADGYSYCVEQIQGVGYMQRPTDCGPYLR